jgi:hypothetical protein
LLIFTPSQTDSIKKNAKQPKSLGIGDLSQLFWIKSLATIKLLKRRYHPTG